MHPAFRNDDDSFIRQGSDQCLRCFQGAFENGRCHLLAIRDGLFKSLLDGNDCFHPIQPCAQLRAAASGLGEVIDGGESCLVAMFVGFELAKHGVFERCEVFCRIIAVVNRGQSIGDGSHIVAGLRLGQEPEIKLFRLSVAT